MATPSQVNRRRTRWKRAAGRLRSVRNRTGDWALPNGSSDHSPVGVEGDLEQLALAGSADAQYQIGIRNYYGIGKVQDLTESARWFSLASDQGHSKSQALLGLQYQDGSGVIRDLEHAKRLYRLAERKGDETAAHNLGYLAEQAGEFKEAAAWYQRGTDLGCALSMASLAFAYSNGRGVLQDAARSLELYEKAAKLGNPMASLNLGTAYLYGGKVPVDHSRGFEYLRLASELENANAYYHLAIACDNGLGTEKDPRLAQMWMSLATLCGVEEARRSVRPHPDLGDSDLGRILALAQDGQVGAIRDVAIRLNAGDGLPKNEAAAKAWLRQAAIRGDAWAQTTLAITLRATKRQHDEFEAVGWLRKAVEQGDPRAKMTLGLHEMLGIGMPADKVAGAAHFLAASLDGEPDARRMFVDCPSVLSTEEIEHIYEITKWPVLSILLGPSPPDHLSELYNLTEEERRGGPKFDRLMEYEKKNADLLFNEQSILHFAYGQPIAVDSYVLTQSIVDGQFATTISINARNIHLPGGSPAYWRPSDKDMDALMVAVQMIEMRTWIRWVWTSF